MFQWFWYLAGTPVLCLFHCMFDRYPGRLYDVRMSDPRLDSALGITLLPPLTERQLQVLRLIERTALERQAYPTQREVAQALGFTQATTGQHIEALVKKGYLSKATGEARRNIRLTTLAVERLKSQGDQQELL
jgi:DNA-binding MarR family transcriptional regulator